MLYIIIFYNVKFIYYIKIMYVFYIRKIEMKLLELVKKVF